MQQAKLPRPPAIRVLPMIPSTRLDWEFASPAAVRSYFLLDLPGRLPSGRYNFRNSCLRAKPGSLVLCQFQSAIRAQSVLRERVDEEFDVDTERYRGYLRLDVSTIRYFRNPISEEMVREIWPDFKFSNARWNLPTDRFERWDALTHQVGFETVAQASRL